MVKKSVKIKKVMKEFKSGSLHSGSKKGPSVTSRKQAIAIALSEAGVSKKPTKVKSHLRKGRVVISHTRKSAKTLKNKVTPATHGDRYNQKYVSPMSLQGKITTKGTKQQNDALDNRLMALPKAVTKVSKGRAKTLGRNKPKATKTSSSRSYESSHEKMAHSSFANKYLK